MGKIADIFEGDYPINWDLARTELDLVIFRATVGLKEDKRYIKYTKDSKVPYGAYHYVTAITAEDSREQARFFVEHANKAYKKPLFYIADIEGDRFNSTNTEPVCVAFLEELRKLGCQKIGMYINRKYKYAGKAIEMCDIMWIPHWGKDDGTVPPDSSKPKHYNDLWQYTSNGTLAGLNEDVDLNLINGDKPLEWFLEGWEPVETAAPATEILGETSLKNGSKGNAVKELQKNLNTLLNCKLDIDGIFGAKTEVALKKFQEAYNLEVTGIYDEQAHKTLMAALSDHEAEEAKQTEEVVAPQTIVTGKTYSTKHSVNVRIGDSTSYEKITNLPKDTIINVVLNKENKPVISSNGWYAIYIMDRIGWLSGNYVKES